MKLLLLAGTAEARTLADALAEMPGITVQASLAGATRQAEPMPLPVRVGGFGGAEAFEAYLRAEKIDAVLDATHPFAAAISARSRTICDALGLPYLAVLRPPWVPQPGDRWTVIADEAEAVRHISLPATVFLATGRQTLDRFAGLAGARIYCRQIDPPKRPFPFSDGGFVVGRPPFAVAEEIALFRELGVNWLVTKNAGGSASRAKLDAARALGLPVLMIARPPATPDRIVPDAAAALDWVRGL